jgi:hypothetical protein
MEISGRWTRECGNVTAVHLRVFFVSRFVDPFCTRESGDGTHHRNARPG